MRAAVLGVCAFAAREAAAVGGSPSFLMLLGDDIGWGDFGYNNGTAHTPHVDAWAAAAGSVVLQDAHSGGTVCSPTRGTILTGRNHFRDCVHMVYGCSDMTECVPDFPFAPQRTFTIGDAFRAAHGAEAEGSLFLGKWHLGSLYNDSEAYGGITSSPATHGFDAFNCTVEVAPTAAANCQCNPAWADRCVFGHNAPDTHCQGGANPGGGRDGCCFNYWWNNASAPHAVTNLTHPTPADDTEYLTSAFDAFLDRRAGAPFLAQISFHNCHIPYAGTDAARAACAAGATCDPPGPENPKPYTGTELDYYSCITELDGGVGRVLASLKARGYYENTLVWFTQDNGPEGDCGPEGWCKGTPHRVKGAQPGSTGGLRGRKRDVWEGGHRVPTVVSWPAVVGAASRVSWGTVVTTDFLPTMMEALGVDRPREQAAWGFDGVSILPLLRGEAMEERGVGWIFNRFDGSGGVAYRRGKWKYVERSASCKVDACKRPMLFDLDADVGETTDLAAERPDVLAALITNFTAWRDSVQRSMAEESLCKHIP